MGKRGGLWMEKRRESYGWEQGEGYGWEKGGWLRMGKKGNVYGGRRGWLSVGKKERGLWVGKWRIKGGKKGRAMDGEKKG